MVQGEALTDDARPQACREYIKAVNAELRADNKFLERFIDDVDKEVRDRIFPPVRFTVFTLVKVHATAT